MVFSFWLTCVLKSAHDAFHDFLIELAERGVVAGGQSLSRFCLAGQSNQHLQGAQIARSRLIDELFDGSFQFADGLALAVFIDDDLLSERFSKDGCDIAAALRSPFGVTGSSLLETSRLWRVAVTHGGIGFGPPNGVILR